MDEDFLICEYQDSIVDVIQWEEYCKIEPLPYDDWVGLAIEWMNGFTEDNPYPLDEKEANKRAMERLH